MALRVNVSLKNGRELTSYQLIKNDKPLIKNYRPVTLLRICSKIFKKVIFNLLFKYVDENILLTSNQSGFQPGDSCIHQLYQ